MAPKDPRGGTEGNAGIREPTLPKMPKLVAASGPGAGRALAMSSALATVGRHPTNDLVLDDPRVSGVHLELRRVGERVHVRDAGSTNGTWIGPHRVTEIELAPGGELVVGATLLRFDIDEEPIPTALTPVHSFVQL